MNYTSAGRSVNGTDLVGCVPSSGHTSNLRGPSPQALTLLGEVRFITRWLKRPFLGECRREQGHFWKGRARLGHGPAPGPTLKKVLCHIRLVSRTADKYRWFSHSKIQEEMAPPRTNTLRCTCCRLYISTYFPCHWNFKVGIKWQGVLYLKGVSLFCLAFFVRLSDVTNITIIGVNAAMYFPAKTLLM